MQFGWSLTLIVDAHVGRALEAFGCFDDVLGNLASNDPVLRRVPHLELASRNLRGGDNFKIGEGHEIANFQLTLAHNGQRRRLYAANTDHSPRALSQDDGRRAGKGQIVDLVGLPASDRGCVKAGAFGVWLRPAECVADCLRVLRGEKHQHDFAAILVMLENLLADELTFAIAIGGEPNPLGSTKGLANGFEFGGFVCALCRASVIKAFRPQKYRRPALPGRHNILRFEEVEQMALGREDISVARTNRCADVFCLAGFLRNDDLIRHVALVWKNKFEEDVIWNI